MKEKTIVFAEKKDAARKRISSLLEGKGYDVVAAKDGIEALQKVISLNPDLIIINNSLPKMKGYQVCKFLKNDYLYKNMPVVLLLSEREKQSAEKAQPGHDEAVTGAFNDEDILEAVERLLKKARKGKSTKSPQKVPYSKSVHYLLDRAIDFIEKRSSENTVFDEMRLVALKNIDFERALDMTLHVLSQIVDYSAAVIYIHESNPGRMAIKITKSVEKDFTEQIRGIVFDQLSARGINVIPSNINETILKDESSGMALKKEHMHFFGEPIIIDGKVRGYAGFAMSSSQDRAMIDERLEFFLAFLHQAFTIIESAHTRDNLLRLSTIDSLTLTNNRFKILELLKKELVRAKRYFLDLSLILFDIDNFKTVNDFYGYQVGDVILKDIAAATIDTMRTIDEVGRYGGEEFLIILPETNLKNAYIAGNRLKERVLSHIFPGIAKDIKVSLSIGVTSYLRDMDISIDDMLRRADQALTEAKKMGKNCVSVVPALPK